MFNERRDDDSSVLISISAGISSKHFVRDSKPPMFTLQRLIFSFLDLKVLGIAKLIFRRSVFYQMASRKINCISKSPLFSLKPS